MDEAALPFGERPDRDLGRRREGDLLRFHRGAERANEREPRPTLFEKRDERVARGQRHRRHRDVARVGREARFAVSSELDPARLHAGL